MWQQARKLLVKWIRALMANLVFNFSWTTTCCSCWTMDPSCSAELQPFLLHTTGCESHYLHELSFSQTPSSSSWDPCSSSSLKRNSPLSANHEKGSLKIVIKDEPIEDLFPFVVVLLIGSSWAGLALMFLMHSLFLLCRTWLQRVGFDAVIFIFTLASHDISWLWRACTTCTKEQPNVHCKWDLIETRLLTLPHLGL